MGKWGEDEDWYERSLERRLAAGVEHFSRLDERVKSLEKIGDGTEKKMEAMEKEIKELRDKVVKLTAIASFVGAVGGSLIGFLFR